MSIYLNASNPSKSFKKAMKRPYFVDKSDMLNELIPLVEMEGEDICITRPRRFGKTMMAQMIASFFEKGNDSGFFDELNISKNPNYLKHRNQHNVFFMDLSYKMSTFHSYDEYICFIQRSLQEDLHEGYPDFPFKRNGDVFDDLNDLSNELDEKFIFVIDEWDAIFHQNE